MITKAETLMKLVDRALQSTVLLGGEDHDFGDISSYLTDVGIEIEKFLKDAIYDGRRNRWNFKQLIDDLEAYGISHGVVDQLNDFRSNWYNKVKHDPSFSASTTSVISALKEVQSAINLLVETDLGTSSAPLVRARRRIFHFAAWDHLNGGDTEVHFMPATNSDAEFSGFEVIYVEMSKWNDVTTELGNLGELVLGPKNVPDGVYQEWRNEEGFLVGGTFEGDYRTLVTALAKYERVEDLLPYLKRENHRASVLASVLAASVDAAAEGDLDQCDVNAVEAIKRISDHRYAVPRQSKLLEAFSQAVVEVFNKLSAENRRSVEGPVWLRSVRFELESKDAIAKSDDFSFAIKPNGTLIARIQ